MHTHSPLALFFSHENAEKCQLCTNLLYQDLNTQDLYNLWREALDRCSSGEDIFEHEGFSVSYSGEQLQIK